jgi:hypothetical protein
MRVRTTLTIDPISREAIEVELPLSFRTTPSEMRAALGLPAFVDLADPTVAKAVGLAFAARRANPPVAIAFFGGVANRLLSPASNDPASGLRRPLHDIDLACRHADVKRVRKFLTEAGASDGSALSIFETAGDRIFNSLAEGRRFRFHDLRHQIDEQIDVGTIDLVADEFRFCHRLDLRPDLPDAAKNGWTLSPTLLLLAKLQFIQRIPASDGARVPDRVLGPFGRHELLIGPEAKDQRDLIALLGDLPLQDGGPSLSVDRFVSILQGDWGLWKTVSLNLGLLERSPLLDRVSPSFGSRVRETLHRLRTSAARLTPRRPLSLLSSQWWQDVDALPSVDGTVSLP